MSNVTIASGRYTLEIIGNAHECGQILYRSSATCTQSDAILAKIGENREQSAQKQEKNCKHEYF